jgi:hypothetical protein
MLQTEPTLEVGQVWEGYNGSTFTIKGKGVNEWLVERNHNSTNTYTESLAEVSFRHLLEFYDAKLVSKPKASLCTCGAAKCGHSGHSSWCDSLVTNTIQVAAQARQDLANTPTYTIKYSVNGSIANSLPSQFPASFDPQIGVSTGWLDFSNKPTTAAVSSGKRSGILEYYRAKYPKEFHGSSWIWDSEFDKDANGGPKDGT